MPAHLAQRWLSLADSGRMRASAALQECPDQFLAFDMVGFRTQHPEIYQLGISNVLSWRNLRKWYKQEGHSDLPPPVFPGTGRKTPM